MMFKYWKYSLFERLTQEGIHIQESHSGGVGFQAPREEWENVVIHLHLDAGSAFG